MNTLMDFETYFQISLKEKQIQFNQEDVENSWHNFANITVLFQLDT